jgi:PncC family amidohydrolase
MVSEVHKLLVRKGLTLACAESCTGGLLAKNLTDRPGSSRFFRLGVIAYANEAKTRVLRVPEKLIREKGAVSAEVAGRMAKNVMRLAKSDTGIGITGIAGPGGAVPGKPIGTVYIAAAGREKTIIERIRFTGDRDAVRRAAAAEALRLLKRLIG